MRALPFPRFDVLTLTRADEGGADPRIVASAQGRSASIGTDFRFRRLDAPVGFDWRVDWICRSSRRSFASAHCAAARRPSSVAAAHASSLGANCSQPAVAHGDGDVSTQSQKSCAAHRRAVEFSLEFGLAQSRQPFQRWIDEFRARLEFGVTAIGPLRRGLSDSTGTHPGRCRSRRPAGPFSRLALRQSAPCARWSDTRCTASRPSGRERRARLSGRPRCSACNCRNDQAICSSPRGLAASLTSSDVRITARNPNEPSFG